MPAGLLFIFHLVATLLLARVEVLGLAPLPLPALEMLHLCVVSSPAQLVISLDKAAFVQLRAAGRVPALPHVPEFTRSLEFAETISFLVYHSYFLYGHLPFS